MHKTPVNTGDIAAHRVTNPVRPPDRDPRVLAAAGRTGRRLTKDDHQCGGRVPDLPSVSSDESTGRGTVRPCKSFLRGTYRAGGRHAVPLPRVTPGGWATSPDSRPVCWPTKAAPRRPRSSAGATSTSSRPSRVRYRLLLADVMTVGVFTKRGRLRATFTALMQPVDRWDRLAQRLGMDRKQRDLATLTAAKYQRHERGPGRG